MWHHGSHCSQIVLAQVVFIVCSCSCHSWHGTNRMLKLNWICWLSLHLGRRHSSRSKVMLQSLAQETLDWGLWWPAMQPGASQSDLKVWLVYQRIHFMFLMSGANMWKGSMRRSLQWNTHLCCCIQSSTSAWLRTPRFSRWRQSLAVQMWFLPVL